MPKTNKPNLDTAAKPTSDAEVLEVMQGYCKKKGYTFSNAQLDYMAQSCFLYFESKGWKGVAYWPAVAMRWCLNNLDKQQSLYTKCQPKQGYKPKPQGKSVRDKIMEEENERYKI